MKQNTLSAGESAAALNIRMENQAGIHKFLDEIRFLLDFVQAPEKINFLQKLIKKSHFPIAWHDNCMYNNRGINRRKAGGI